MVDRGKLDTSNTHIHERSLSWLGTDTSIKVVGLTSLLGQTSPLSEII
jgi:hypothetical protein